MKAGASLVNMLAEDKKLVTYRPRLNEITGRVTATILLQQVLFRAQQVDYQPFYKFRAPCGHTLYREGDSWTEELGFTVREFDTALKAIGTKIKKGNNKADALNGTGVRNLVIYWTDASRVTWYLLNVGLLERMLERLYANCASSDYQVNAQVPDTRNLPRAQLPIPETTIEGNQREDSNSNSPLLELTIDKLSRKFGDVHHKCSNVSQAYNLWGESDLDEEEFLVILEKASAITLQAVSKSQVKDRGKRMAYFFAVVRDLLDT